MLEVFQLGPFLFRIHLLFLLLGVWFATALFLRLALADGLPVNHFLERGWWYLLSFFFGGRFLALISLYRVYLQDPSRIFIVWDGVFSFLGGCVGIAVVLFFLTWLQRTTFLQWLDALVPAASLGLAFDWFGRFLGSLSYGKPTNVPWGVTIESMSVRYTVPIHPVQLYYALFFLALTVLLLRMRKRGLRRAGFVTLLGILLGALSVIFFESFRGDIAVTVFAKVSDFVFLALLFASLGVVVALETKISHRYSVLNSLFMATGTVVYLLARPWISVASVEWRFSQFLAVLAALGTIVYVVVHRWKYPHL